MAALFRMQQADVDPEEAVVSEEATIVSVGTKWSTFKYVAWTIVIIIVALLALNYFNLLPIEWFHSGPGYQAVFLTNGQVYFGKLYREDGQFAVLRDIYYLQVTQSPQPIQPGQTPPTNINLVKLGGELHGPTDEMRINRDQILFVEDLSSGSRVVDAINKLKAGPAK